MLDILAITGPIYLCIALGWLATRAGLFARADMRVLGQFVLYIALPALLFDAVGKRPIGDILDWRYLGIYALGGLATIALGLAWTRRVARQAPLACQIYPRRPAAKATSNCSAIRKASTSSPTSSAC